MSGPYRRVMWIMVFVILLAAGLRVVGLSFGNPARAGLPDERILGSLSDSAPIHPDEYYFVARPLQMLLSGELNPRFFHNPTLQINLNYAQFWFSGMLGMYGGQHDRSIGMREYAPFHLYVQARMTSVWAGVLAVALVFFSGRRLLGMTAALAAALLVAVSFLSVQHSHYAKSSMMAVAMMAGATGFSLRLLYLRRPGYAAYLIPGLFIGLATSARYTAAAVGIIYVACAVVVFYRQRIWKPALVGLLAIPFAFFGTSPYALRDFGYFVDQVIEITTRYRTSTSPDTTDFGLFYEYRFFFFFGLGVVGFLAALWGVIVAFWRRPAWGNLLRTNSPTLVILILVVFLVIYSWLALNPRQLGDQLLLHIIPATALLAGYGFQDIIGRFPVGRARQWALAGGVVLLTGWPLWTSAQFSAQLAQPDTRDIASRWVQDNVPAGTAVHLLGPYNVPLNLAAYPATQNYAWDYPSLQEIQDMGASLVIYSDAWYHDLRRGAEYVDADFLTEIEAYLAGVLGPLEELARFERPQWPGYDMPLHTASYWHNPTIIVYALPEHTLSDMP